MPFSIVRDDIARVAADVLVNAANERLAPGAGVCGAIFAGAGFDRMRAACEAVGRCPTGSAVVTPGFDLPCRWVAHTVGPVWRGGGAGEERLLRSCYRSVFAEVERLGASSVAFPLISAGIYGYPVRAALDVAREEAAAFLADSPDVSVTLVVFSRDVVSASVGLLGELREFIDDTYVDESPYARRGWGRARDAELEGAFLAEASPCHAPVPASMPPSVAAGAAAPVASPPLVGGEPLDDDLARRLDALDAPFSEALLALIDARGLTDAQVYKRANLSRQLFSKIRSNPAYRPTKPTAVALAMALELDVDETQGLLARAGLTLSHSSRFDVIVEFFIARGVFDVLRVNEALFAFDQPLLGSF